MHTVAINAHTSAFRLIQKETSIMSTGSMLTMFRYFIEQNEMKLSWTFQQAKESSKPTL